MAAETCSARASARAGPTTLSWKHGADVGADFVDLGIALPAEAAFEHADELQRDEDEDGGESGDEVEAGAAGHADGGDDPDGGRAGEAEDAVLGVEDEAGAEEANALHDVGGDLAALFGLSPAMTTLMMVKSAEPMQMRMLVRRPESLWRHSRSRPTTPPRSAGHEQTLDGGAGEHELLERGEMYVAGIHHRVRILLGGRQE